MLQTYISWVRTLNCSVESSTPEAVCLREKDHTIVVRYADTPHVVRICLVALGPVNTMDGMKTYGRKLADAFESVGFSMESDEGNRTHYFIDTPEADFKETFSKLLIVLDECATQVRRGNAVFDALERSFQAHDTLYKELAK